MEASPLDTLVSVPLHLLFLRVLDCAGVSPRAVSKVDLLHSGVPQSKAPRSPSTNVCLHVLDCTSQVKFKCPRKGSLSREPLRGSALPSLPPASSQPPCFSLCRNLHSFLSPDDLHRAPFPFLFSYQLEGSGSGKCPVVNSRLVPTGQCTQKVGGNESPPISPTPSWESEIESCPKMVEVIQKQLGNLQVGSPDGISGKEPSCQCRRRNRCRFDSWIGKIS